MVSCLVLLLRLLYREDGRNTRDFEMDFCRKCEHSLQIENPEKLPGREQDTTYKTRR